MNKRYLILAALLVLMISSCKKQSISEVPLSEDPIITYTEHFIFSLNDGLSKNILPSIQSMLENNYSRILDDLDVSSMNDVTVRLWNNESNFLDDMENVLGVRYSGSSGWVRGVNDIRLLYRGNGTAQNALHEFCHTVSLVVNPNFGNNPRWLWEAVAIYESGEFVDPHNLNYLVSGDFPTIAELNSDFNNGNHSIYQVGYLLSEFIIENWDKSHFVDLIISNGNISQVLQMTTQEFEAGWKSFVQTKYLNQ